MTPQTPAEMQHGIESRLNLTEAQVNRLIRKWENEFPRAAQDLVNRYGHNMSPEQRAAFHGHILASRDVFLQTTRRELLEHRGGLILAQMTGSSPTGLAAGLNFGTNTGTALDNLTLTLGVTV